MTKLSFLGQLFLFKTKNIVWKYPVVYQSDLWLSYYFSICKAQVWFKLTLVKVLKTEVYPNCFLMSNVCLVSQVSDSLSVPCVSALVLDEDGTGVDTEEFFQTLPENAVLMVLEKAQKWTPHPVSY